MHSASIHKYRDFKILVIVVASLNVNGSSSKSTPLRNFSKRELVSFMGSSPPQQWLKVKYSILSSSPSELTSLSSGDSVVPTSSNLVGSNLGRPLLKVVAGLQSA